MKATLLEGVCFHLYIKRMGECDGHSGTSDGKYFD